MSAAPVQSKKDLFRSFVEESSLYEEAQISEIRKIDGKNVVAIDAGIIAEELRQLVQSEEPLWLLQGPVPHAVKSFLERYVNRFTAIDVRPVVVFNGMKVQQLSPNAAPSAPIRFDSWGSLMGQQITHKTMSGDARSLLEKEVKDQPFSEEVFLAMTNALRDAKVEVWTAPFWAWGQMAAFMADSNKCVGEVHGPLELLMFRGVDRVITSINSDKGTFRYVSKKKVIETIRTQPDCKMISEDDLSHAMIVDSAHPNLHEEPVHYGNFHSFLHIFSEFLNGQTKGIVKRMVQQEDQVKFPFFRARAAIECPPVFHHSGDCVPLSKLNQTKVVTYSALRDVFGFPVPPLYYYFLSSGLLSPSVLNTVISQRIIDHAPIAESREFQQTAEMIIPLRTQIVYQLIQLLSSPNNQNFYQPTNNYQLVWYRTYHQKNAQNVGSQNAIPILRPPPIKLDEWTNLQQVQTPVSFFSVLNYAENAQTVGTYSKADAAVAAIHLKALDLLGYFTHATHANSTEVSGPSIYSEALGRCCPPLSQFGVLLIELIRTKNLTDDPLHLAGPGNVADSNPGRGIHFATRVCCMLPVALKSAWTGPINGSLLAYNAMLNAMHQTLRSLVEVISVTLYFGDDANPNSTPNTFGVDQYIDLSEKLPFREPPSIYGGIIMRHILLDESFGKSPSPEAAHTNLTATFPDVANLKADVSTIFSMWTSTVHIMEELHKEDPNTYGKIKGDIQAVNGLVNSRMGLLGLSA